MITKTPKLTHSYTHTHTLQGLQHKQKTKLHTNTPILSVQITNSQIHMYKYGPKTVCAVLRRTKR